MSFNDYKTTITKIGHMADELLEEGIIIVFNDNAMETLAEISAMHTVEKMEREVCVGDKVIFGSNGYVVTAVGGEANRTLKSMGHCTFCFKGAEKAALPGQIELSGADMPKLAVGDRFEILFLH